MTKLIEHLQAYSEINTAIAVIFSQLSLAQVAIVVIMVSCLTTLITLLVPGNGALVS